MMLVGPSTPQAEMQFKDRWFACLSLGERTYRTETSDQLTLRSPSGDQKRNLCWKKMDLLLLVYQYLRYVAI
ncbi:hypothetical protein GW17_00030269 [Ensete ventricosum]|nr:hypothetical protein GW17_00030269 [Ensete ventricosum]